MTDHKWVIQVCKDRTLTYRRDDEPIFNKVAKPVYVVNDEEVASSLVVLLGSVQYEEHPQLPGEVWRKINVEFKQHLEREDLDYVTVKVAEAHLEIIRARGAA